MKVKIYIPMGTAVLQQRHLKRESDKDLPLKEEKFKVSYLRMGFFPEIQSTWGEWAKMSSNDQFDKLRNMVLAFRMSELQTLMVFAGR